MNFAANMSARVYYSQGGLFNRTVNPGRDLTPPSGGAGGAVHTHISRQHAIKRATVATSRCCGSSLALSWSVLVIFFLRSGKKEATARPCSCSKCLIGVTTVGFKDHHPN